MKFKFYFKVKRWYLVTFFLIFLILITLLLIQKKTTPPPLPSISHELSWQIGLSYDQAKKTLSLKKVTILKVKSNLDDRSALLSKYTLTALDQSGSELYRVHIHINELILVDFISPQVNGPIPRFPTQIYSEIYLPFTEQAQTLQIKRAGTLLLTIRLPKKVSFHLTHTAFAQTPLSSVSCGPIQVVFINDNYDGPLVSQFQSDVQYLSSLYNSTPPYNTTPSVFDFREIDQPQHYECATDLYGCYIRMMNNTFQDQQSTAFLLAKTRFPDVKKVIVISNSTSSDLKRVGGITGGPGGDVVAYTNLPDEQGRKFFSATHEFLGHAMGYLYDRYVINQNYAISMNQLNYGAIGPADPRSNCTDNPAGEANWPGSYQGCANHTNFAPYPLTCDYSSLPGSSVDNGGNPNTVMSAPGCSATNQFDTVEQEWIRNRVVSLYQKACTPSITQSPPATLSLSPTVHILPSYLPSSSPSPTFSPSPTLSPSPTTGTLTPTQTTSASSSPPIDNSDVTPIPIIARCTPNPSCLQKGKSLQLCTLECVSSTPSPSPSPTVPGGNASQNVITQAPTVQPQSPACGVALTRTENTPASGCCIQDGTISGSCCEGVARLGTGQLICDFKPVIYLYPPSAGHVNVSLIIPGIVTKSSPLYNQKTGWKDVLASPNGMLTYQNRAYTELFYETALNKKITTKNGVVIKKSDAMIFLSALSDHLGLIRNEKKEFIDFWVPKITSFTQKYVFVGVYTQVEKDQIDLVDIFPKPDVFIQFNLYIKPLDNDHVSDELILPQVPRRHGFTAVEWGGVIDY